MERRRFPWLVPVVPVLAWYLWPTVTRSADRIDVVVVGDGAVVSASDEIARHLRERGLSVQLAGDVDPCSPGSLSAATSGARAIVVSYTAAVVERCSEAVTEAVGRLDDPIVVAQDAGGLPATVDATRLVPPSRGARTGCQWWEPARDAGAIANCEADGSITIRDDGGGLTLAGRDRFARVVAGAVP